MKKLLLLLFAISLSISTFPQKATHTFALGDRDFLLDGKPFQILAGEIHYLRIPKEYWRHRLRMARAMGLNTVTTYVFWNTHELKQGQFDFASGNRNLAEFLKIAQEEGLWVILRPGPYACAEWEFGGYPWWLLKEKDLQVRSRDPRFLKALESYINELGRQVKALQITHGGPILMVQVENEYGSFSNDKEYLANIRDMIKNAGFDVTLYTDDGPVQCKDGYLPGLLPAINGETNPQALIDTVNKYHGGKGPYFTPEYYPGWLDHWGEPKSKVGICEILPSVEALLKAGISISFYMLHGGTNFGFMNGANYTREFPIQPDITSYDYDAPITEHGAPRAKYYALKELLSGYQPENAVLPEVPAVNPIIGIPEVKLTESVAMLQKLPEPVVSDKILSMEDIDQGYGFILYRTTLSKPVNGFLRLKELRDFAVILIDGHAAGTLNRRLKTDSLMLDIQKKGAVLDILVENMGRINYGSGMRDNRKGITDKVLLNNKELKKWQIYSLPFGSVENLNFSRSTPVTAPILKRGNFTLNKTGDTFLDMSKWGKGVVWVNGHNLGRFWNIGPQQTLYCPAPFLKTGKNEIIVLDLIKTDMDGIEGVKVHVLDELK